MPKIEKDLLKVKGSDGQWHYVPAVGGSVDTAPTWESVQNKPFSTLGGGLEVDENGVLSAKGGVELSQKAEVGEVLTVEEVDGDGKPSKWKSVDANAVLTIDNTGYKGTDYYALPDGVYNLLSLYVANKDGMNLRLQGVTSVKNHSFVCAEKNTNVIFGSDGSVVGYDYGVWRWSEKENVSNKVTSLSATSKDSQYPSAKAVYDALTTAIPKTLPNPHKLTFAGAVTGEYDGSSALTVDIPQGGDSTLGITSAAVGQIIKIKSVDTTGKPTEWEAADLPIGGDKWELITSGTIAEDASLTVNKDSGGKAFELKSCQVVITGAVTGIAATYLRFSVSGENNYHSVEMPLKKENPTIKAVYYCINGEVPMLFWKQDVGTTAWTSNENSCQFGLHGNQSYALDTLQHKITSIYIGNYMGTGKLAAGTKYEIYGVRV